jgi:hypothetical protein
MDYATQDQLAAEIGMELPRIPGTVDDAATWRGYDPLPELLRRRTPQVHPIFAPLLRQMGGN